jgi:amidophosphoribosyltransferase
LFDKLKEECGLFGIYDRSGVDCARQTYYALYALQHRGQESTGIAVNDNGIIINHKDTGLVADVFNDVILNHLEGHSAIGHVRYSMASRRVREDAQPLVTRYRNSMLAIAYNGSLVDSEEERQRLEDDGAVFQTNCDAEIISYLLAKERMSSPSIEDALAKILQKLNGGYSILLLSRRKLIAARDVHGFRPLCLGKTETGYVFASESCALSTVGAEFVRDVEPGEVVVISDEGIRSIKSNREAESALCIFEYIYFARPDSVIEGVSVYQARKNAGKELARTHKVDADLVIGVPDSGICAAIGYSEGSGIPYGEGLIKNRYIGRTFIQPSQSMRRKSVDLKLSALSASVCGKRIIMVDDSIVRGTTCANIIKMLKKAGATEVHLRITSPKFLYPCYFGTDVPSCSELVACNHSTEEMCAIFGADSLAFLEMESLPALVAGRNRGFCDGCFSGKYITKVPASKTCPCERSNEND